LRFHTIRCAASDELTISTAKMLLEYSWPMRLNTRSAPVRSTRTATPGYLASNARATFSASGRSTEVYQTTLPSFFAASISAGVTALAGGAADTTWACAGGVNLPAAASALEAASAAEPCSTRRLENLRIFIVRPPSISVPPARFLMAQPLNTRQRSGCK
jgi:hypothetical protein